MESEEYTPHHDYRKVSFLTNVVINVSIAGGTRDPSLHKGGEHF